MKVTRITSTFGSDALDQEGNESLDLEYPDGNPILEFGHNVTPEQICEFAEHFNVTVEAVLSILGMDTYVQHLDAQV